VIEPFPCCLVVEDEALIAMGIEASLEDAGFRVAGPFMSNAAALAWLETNTPDVVLLDVLLRDGPCTLLVHALRRRKIPFVIYSGLRPRNIPPELATVQWLEKPVARDDLARALREIAPKPGQGASFCAEPAPAYV
jgi:DNA-binding response OmpR family regulator